MNNHSKYRPVLDKVQSQIMKAEIGVTGVYQVMLEALDEAETAELALREELAALRAENDRLTECLERTLSTLEDANKEGVIVDTIWYSDIETLFDFLRSRIPDEEQSSQIEAGL